jgi:hypothetical protein
VCLFKSLSKSDSVPRTHPVFGDFLDISLFWMRNFDKITLLELGVRDFYDFFSLRKLEKLLRDVLVLAVGLLDKDPHVKNHLLHTLLNNVFLVDRQLLRHIFDEPCHIVDVHHFDPQSGKLSRDASSYYTLFL